MFGRKTAEKIISLTPGILLSQLCAVTMVYSLDNIRVFMNPTLVNASAQATPRILLACSCSTAIVSTTSTVVWRRNYVEIPASELQSNSSRYSSSLDVNGGTANFIIHSPQPEDTGTYDCKVLINGSHVTSPAAQITVADTLPTYGYEVVRGLDVEVHCPIEKTIPLYYPVFWSKNGAEVLSGKKHQHQNSRSLKITKADYRDSGVYQCVVLTAEGTKSTEIKVTVQGPPEAPLQLSFVSQPHHQDCSLVQWKRPNFDGNSPIKSYNLTCIDHYSGHSLTVGCNGDTTRMTVNRLEVGIHYDCNLQAVNDLGCSNSSNVVHMFCPAAQTTQGGLSASGSSTPSSAIEMVVTVATSATTSSTQFVTALVVTLVFVLGFVICLILFVWIRSRFRQTGKYRVDGVAVMENGHAEDDNTGSVHVQKSMEVAPMATILRQTEI